MQPIHFLTPLSQQPFIVVAYVVFLGVLLFLEIRKASKRFLWVRLFLVCLVAFALLLLGLQPAYQQEKERVPIALLTPNFDKNQLAQLKSKYENLQIFNHHTLRSQDTTHQHQKVKVAHPTQLLPYESTTDTLFILGNGLAIHECQNLEKFNIRLLLNETITGITDIEYPTHISVNSPISISGQYSNYSEQVHHLSLEQSGINDKKTIVLPPQKQTNFAFTYTPPQAGNFVYHLIVKDSLQTVIQKEPLAIEVKESDLLKVLLLQNAPNFEQKYLKNWLASEKHKVYIRNSISKEKYQYDFLNTKRFNWSNLTSTFLEQIDLLLVDVSSFQKLSSTEKKRLSNAIQEGLSILFFANNIDELNALKSQTKLLKDFRFQRHKKDQTDIRLNATKTTLNTIDASIRNRSNITPILQDIYGQNLVAFDRQGLGKVGVSTIKETYPIILQGKQQTHTQLWTKILQDFAQESIRQNQWNSPQTPLIFPNEPTALQLYTNEVIPLPEVYRQDSLVGDFPLAQDLYLPEKWSGLYWFDTVGWHELSTQENLDEQPFYVFAPTDWQALRLTQQIEQFQDWHKKQKAQSIATVPSFKSVLIPLYWWYLLLLVSLGLLWLVGKLEE